MTWEKIFKVNPDQWGALSDVILEEYDYERWKDTKIPEKLKNIKKKYDSSDSTTQSAVKELLEEGFKQNDETRKGLFTIIRRILGISD